MIPNKYMRIFEKQRKDRDLVKGIRINEKQNDELPPSN